jgi:CRISPR system Cascade subunit CasD
MGRRRTDSLEDFLGLRLAVRIDVPGSLLRDFQTAIHLTSGAAMPLTYRDYIQDGVFTVGMSGDDDLIDNIAAAISSPRYPLYLGRRSCVPTGPLVPILFDGSERMAVAAAPWAATDRLKRSRGRTVDLEVVADADDDDPSTTLLRDLPLSFDPQRREHGFRPVHRYRISAENPDGVSEGGVNFRSDHDPMAMELP